MRVKNIRIDRPFLRILAEYLCDRFSGLLPDLSQILVVFPTQRNKYYFRRYLLEASNKSGVILPEMVTIEEFINDCYEYLDGKKGLLLNKLERNFILKYTIDKLKVKYWEELPFLRFISIGDRLLSFFDELARERVSLKQIEELILMGHYPEQYTKNELPIIRSIFDAYRRNIADQGFQDEIDRCNLIFEKFSGALLDKYRYICIAGLVATTTLENRLLKEILRKENSELVIHSDTLGLKGEFHPANPFYQHQKLLKRLDIENCEELQLDVSAQMAEPVIHIIRTESNTEQCLYIGRLLSRIKGHYEPHRIAVIITDESIVCSITEALRNHNLEYNLSIGQPFGQSLLFSFLEQLISAINNSLHYREFFAFLKHPLVKNAVRDGTGLRPLVYRFIRKMVDDKTNYFTRERYSNADFEPLLDFVRECIDTVSMKVDFQEYINRIIELLSRILADNKEFIESAGTGIKEFFERLNSLSKLRIPEGSVEPGIETLNFILRVIKDERYHISGEPMKGIQIIGLLEARNLDFDCVILPSMNEGIFPTRSEKDLFVNQRVREELGLPYDKERENLYYYYFKEIISGKNEVFIIYTEEKKKDIPSRFINFLVDEGKVIHNSGVELKDININLIKRAVKKEQGVIRRLKGLLTRRGLSPSGLQCYRECPYRFYLKYLLKIDEPKQIVEEPGPLEWGRAYHIALSRFYRYDFPDGFTEEQVNEAQKKLAQRLEYALRQEVAQKPASTIRFDLENHKRRLFDFLKNEIARFKKGYRINRAVLESPISYKIELDGHKVLFSGIPDRIDLYQGKFYIIDYKKTVPRAADYKIGEGFKEFQLPLYAIMVTQGQIDMVCGMAYYSLSKIVKVVEIVREDEIITYLNDFKEKVLLPVIKEILDPNKEFYQSVDPEHCSYCIYKYICGVERGRD